MVAGAGRELNFWNVANDQRRSHPRQLRRVQIRFQREGEERVHHGFSKNLSLSGALISAPDLPPRGTRLRLELVGKESSPVIYGVVVHAHRVPPELRRFAESAMGVRFLETAELVAPFLPAEATTRQPERPQPARPAARPQETLASGPWPISGGRSGAAEGSKPAPGSGRYAMGAASEMAGVAAARATRRGRAAGDGTGVEEKPAVVRDADIPPERVYTLTFSTAADFLGVFRRDLVNGGLFVASGDPASLQERVVVALRLPDPVQRTFRIEARVVQVVEPRPGPGGGRTGGGMGLEMIDADRVLDELRPLVGMLQA